MSDDNKYNDDDKNAKKGGDFRVPPRTWVVWIAIFGGIILLMLVKERWEPQADALTQYKFQQLVESNLIVSATINYSPQSPDLREIVGKYKKLDHDKEVVTMFRTKARLYPKLEKKLLSISVIEPREPNTMLWSVAVGILPFVVIALLIYFFF